MARSFLCSLAALTIIMLVAATTTPHNDITDLRQKYMWGSIYVPNGVLIDMKNTFGAKNHDNKNSTANAEGFRLVSGFVKANVGTRSGEGAAFLQLDLNELRAGFAESNAYGGSVTQLSWTHDQVVKAAVFVDGYLFANEEAVAFAKAVATTNHANLEKSWEQLIALTDNELVAPSVAAQAQVAFRQSIDMDSAALQQLRMTNPQIAQKIDTFVRVMDADRESHGFQFGSQQKKDSYETWFSNAAPYLIVPTDTTSWSWTAHNNSTIWSDVDLPFTSVTDWTTTSSTTATSTSTGGPQIDIQWGTFGTTSTTDTSRTDR